MGDLLLLGTKIQGMNCESMKHGLFVTEHGYERQSSMKHGSFVTVVVAIVKDKT